MYTRMKKTTVWLTEVEDQALDELGRERARSRSHVMRMAIRREAGIDDDAYDRAVRGGWDSLRGKWIFSAQEELVQHLANQGMSIERIATELRLPRAGVEDILVALDRKLSAYGDAWIGG